MAAHSMEHSPADFLLHAHKRLSVALQSSNANTAQLPMQNFHLHQLAAGMYMDEKNRDQHWARTTKYAQAAHGDQLTRQVSLVMQAAECHAQERAADLADAASEAARLVFVHQRHVGVADIARSISQCGLVSVAAQAHSAALASASMHLSPLLSVSPAARLLLLALLFASARFFLLHLSCSNLYVVMSLLQD